MSSKEILCLNSSGSYVILGTITAQMLSSSFISGDCEFNLNRSVQPYRQEQRTTATERKKQEVEGRATGRGNGKNRKPALKRQMATANV